MQEEPNMPQRKETFFWLYGESIEGAVASAIGEAYEEFARGRPDPRHMSTSYAERNNLNCRPFLRRLTRLTNAFSKKVENLVAALWLYFAHYNFVRIHGS